MELKPWKLLDAKTAFKNRWWNIMQETVELPDGARYSDYFVNHVKGAVAVFAVTEDGKVLVNRQYKHGAREIIHEFTVGRYDDGDADPLTAARRELREETGYGEGDWQPLGVMIANPSSSTSRIHAYLARGVRKIAAPTEDAKEIVEVAAVAPAEALRMAFEGALSTDVALSLIFLAAKRLGWIAETL